MTSEIDDTINEHFRVVPGIGEFGDRYFGTEEDDEFLTANGIPLGDRSGSSSR